MATKYKQMKYKLLILISLLPNLLLAQTIEGKLNLEKAIQIALENNYDIKTAKNQLQQAKNSNTKGNAGLLPSVSAGGGADYSDKDIKMKMRSNNQVVSTDGANTTTFTGNIRVDYTLFGGFGKIYTYKKLKNNNERAKWQYRMQIENTILQTAQAYYAVCNASQQLNLSKKSIAISADRLKRAKARQEFGQAGTLDILNAEVDYNADSTRMLNAELQYKNSIKNLNVVLGITVDTNYKVDDAVQFTAIDNEAVMQQKAMQNNSIWLMQQYLQKMAALDVKITKSQRYPSLSAYGTYAYYRQNAGTGQNKYLQQTGPGAGLSLRWNIFNGKQQRIREKNAVLQLENTQIAADKLKAQLQRDIANAYTDFDYKKRTITLQERSRARAKLNFERTQELYRLGQVNSIAFRTAQQNYLNAENAYNASRYAAKLSEIILLKTAGQLVK